MKIRGFLSKLLFLGILLISCMLGSAICFRLTTLDKELLMNRINETKAADILKILNINIHSNFTNIEDNHNSSLLNSSLEEEDISLREEDVLKSNCKY